MSLKMGQIRKNRQVKNDNQLVQYCLYARKSSESDERQAMSIDSQIKEMTELARRDNLYIKNIYKESHSAKSSGTRQVFNQLLNDIREKTFTGILTWAPDRLSRNAGDLGMLVDLMDQEKLLQIRTFSQTFSNTPNEKFLLMILCSQAKLENDQKGINVKRGIRAKCEQGWRPGMAPLGYFNRAFAGTKDIIIDPERGPIVKEAFERVAYRNHSGRILKEWLDKVGFSNRSGKKISLSQVYLMLRRPFYYGEFEYPEGSGNWYRGKHKPLISRDLFNLVQTKLIPSHTKKWGSKNFAFTKFLKCGSCKSGITAEEKYRKLKLGGHNHHIYYHCTRSRDLRCKEKCITEKDLIKQLIYLIEQNKIEFKKENLSRKLKQEIIRFKRFKIDVLEEAPWRITVNKAGKNKKKKGLKDKTIKAYAKHILRIGSADERKEAMALIKNKIYLINRTLKVNLEKKGKI